VKTLKLAHAHVVARLFSDASFSNFHSPFRRRCRVSSFFVTAVCSCRYSRTPLNPRLDGMFVRDSVTENAGRPDIGHRTPEISKSEIFCHLCKPQLSRFSPITLSAGFWQGNVNRVITKLSGQTFNGVLQ